MWNWFARILGLSRAPARPVHPLEDAGPTRITTPARIQAILEDLSRHQMLLSIVVPDSHYPFVSSLLRIDDGMLIFDEFKPACGQRLVQEQGRFKVEAVLRGIGLSFTISDFHAEERGGVVTYIARPPGEISHLQRRRSHRIPIGPTRHIGFHGDPFVDDRGIHGTVANLSREGLAFLAKLSAPLSPGSDLINCTITLPEGETVRFNLTICFVETLPWARRSVVGGRFSSISAKDQNRLESFLMGLERQILQEDE